MDQPDFIVRPNKKKLETQVPVDIGNSFSALEDIDNDTGQSCGPAYCCDEGKTILQGA